MDIKFYQTKNNILLNYVKPYTSILFHIFPQLSPIYIYIYIYIYICCNRRARKRKDLIITNADKGGAVVIMDTDSYIKEANQQLSYKASYKQLTLDPKLQLNKMVNQTIQRFKNAKLLPQKIADGLKITNPKTPKFYISPKIHKPNNPGRPAINSIECHASEILRFVTISSLW